MVVVVVVVVRYTSRQEYETRSSFKQRSLTSLKKWAYAIIIYGRLVLFDFHEITTTVLFKIEVDYIIWKNII